MAKEYEFEMSAKELKFLQQLVLRDEEIAGLLRFEQPSNNRGAIVRLDGAHAEQLRDWLTEQLAAIGFDEKYSPNERGRMLENLIDRFYLP